MQQNWAQQQSTTKQNKHNSTRHNTAKYDRNNAKHNTLQQFAVALSRSNAWSRDNKKINSSLYRHHNHRPPLATQACKSLRERRGAKEVYQRQVYLQLWWVHGDIWHPTRASGAREDTHYRQSVYVQWMWSNIRFTAESGQAHEEETWRSGTSNVQGISLREVRQNVPYQLPACGTFQVRSRALSVQTKLPVWISGNF